MSDPFKTFRAGMRWFHRVWWKLLLGGVGFVLLLGGLWLYGLRYGFVPLPKPPPGFSLNYPPPNAVPLDQTTNGWAVIEVLNWPDIIKASSYLGWLEDLADGGVAKIGRNGREEQVTNFTQLCQKVEAAWASPMRPERLEGLLRQPDEFATPVAFSLSVSADESEALALRIMGANAWALALAGKALEHGRPNEALDYVITALAMNAASTSAHGGYPRDTGDAVTMTLLVAISPESLNPEETQRQITALQRTTAMLPSLEDCYRAQVAQMLPSQPACVLDWDYISDWEQWFAYASSELSSLGDDLKALPRALMLRLGGSNEEFSWPRLDLGKLAGRFWQTLAWETARPKDVERAVLAAASHGLAQIRRAESPLSEDVVKAANSAEKSEGWWRILSQPIAWIGYAAASHPERVAKSRGWFLRGYETCRLLLALRLRRDAIGHWPDSLEELAPDFLEQVPADPLTGRPFRYRHRGAHWLLWVDDDQGHRPGQKSFSGLRIWSAKCLLGNWEWKLELDGSETFFRNTPHLDDLLHLLPEGADSVAPLDRLTMKRYGLLPNAESDE